MQVDAGEVLDEVRTINPMVVELAMERVARRRLEKDLESMRRAFTEQVPEDEDPEQESA